MLLEEAHSTSVGILGLGAIGLVMASLIKLEFTFHAYNHSLGHQLKLLKGTKETAIPIQCFASLKDAPSSDWLLILPLKIPYQITHRLVPISSEDLWPILIFLCLIYTPINRSIKGMLINYIGF